MKESPRTEDSISGVSSSRLAATTMLSASLRGLAARFKQRPVRLQEVMDAIHGRGYNLLLILLSAPFLTPVPLPLVSTPFGVIIALVGLRLALGRKEHLPRRIMNRRLPPRFFPKLLSAAGWLISWIERVVRPRMEFFHGLIVFKRAAGALIGVSGLLLLLPLPVPFSNFFPACTVMLLASGALGRDGLFYLGGCASFCVSAGYFVLIPLGGMKLVNSLLGG